MELDQAMHLAWIRSSELVASVLPDAATARIGEWFVYDGGVGNVDFNIAAVAGDSLRAASELPLVDAWFEQRGGGFGYRLRPARDLPVIACLSSDVPEQSRQPYLVSNSGPAGWRGGPSDLQIVEAQTVDSVEHYDSFDAERGRPEEWSIAGAVLSLEECRLWLGYCDGEPAARAMSVATTPVGTIANVVVKERFRRRGFGRAITLAAMAACAEAGSTFVCLGASSMGLPMYVGMGFEQRYELATYQRA